jgi:GDPmannose 4,6-dehydratase
MTFYKQINMKVAFITGITGQDGSYLAEILLEKEYKVYGIVRRNSSLFNYERIEHIRSRLNLEYGDLTDGSSLMIILNKIIGSEYPEGISRFEIYNLGAQSHVQISFENPEYTSLVDGIGTLKILEAIRAMPKNIRDITRFYQAGTSEMFGAVLEKPQKETTPFNPQSPYACAKVYSHFLVNNYRDAYGLFACNGILFNHESSRRGYNFVTMKIVRGVKKIQEQVSHDQSSDHFVLELGNLDSMRDWGYAKNYVYGMWLMLQHDKPDNYVLATNKTYSVRDFAERCFRKIGIEIVWEGDGLLESGRDKITGRVYVRVNEKFFRPCEVDFLLGDASKAEKELGWKSDSSLDELIDEMFRF